MWNEVEYMNKMKPVVDKFLLVLAKKGISFSLDTEMNNVILSTKTKSIKMSHHSFYRFSGITSIYKHNDDNSIEIIKVTDEMYLTTFIKPIIEILLLGNEKV